jgi:glycerol-3-phosphate acyltransferase PlsY
VSVLGLLLIGAVGYLLGSFPSGVVVVRFWTGKDLRRTGSGHTGGMNVRRVAGLAPAVLTVLADAAKAIVAVRLAQILGPQPWAVPVAAVAAVAGHCWPLYTRFQGGMGLGSAAFILLYLSPLSLIALVVVFPLWYLILRHRYRASVATVLTLPLVLWTTGNPPPLIVLGLAIAVVISIRHVPSLTHPTAGLPTRKV